MLRSAIIKGAIFCGLAVVLGAFGAHGLRTILPQEQINIFETGVRYQFYHGMALLMVGILYAHIPSSKLRLAAHLFTAGIIGFSGSLYLLIYLMATGKALGMAGIITPIGGLLFIAGWVMVVIAAVAKPGK